MGREWLQKYIIHYKLGGCRFESCLVTVESVISRGGSKAGEMANCKIWESVHYPIECVIEIYGAVVQFGQNTGLSRRGSRVRAPSAPQNWSIGVKGLCSLTVYQGMSVRVRHGPQMNFSLDARSISKAEHSML